MLANDDKISKSNDKVDSLAPSLPLPAYTQFEKDASSKCGGVVGVEKSTKKKKTDQKILSDFPFAQNMKRVTSFGFAANLNVRRRRRRTFIDGPHT